MDNVLLQCFIARICLFFRLHFQKSVLGKFCRAIKNSYLKSKTCKFLCTFLSIPSTIVYSRTYKLLLSLNNALHGFGSRIVPVIQKSAVYRACRAFGDSKAISNSFIVRILQKAGIRGLLIIAFSMYLPLDWFIRDILGIDALGAIWDEGFMLASVLYIIWRIMTHHNQIKPRLTPVDGPLLLFLAIGLLVLAMVSPSMSIAVDGYRAVCQFMLWFFVMTRLIENDRDLHIFYYSMCVMALIIGLHGIYQYIIGAPMPEKWVAAAETDMRTRVYSITGSPNIMGALMIMTAPMLAALAYYVKPLWAKCLMWGATGILCLAVLATFSRGAWFGLAVAVVLFCLIVDIRLLVIALVTVLGLVFCVPAISNRIGFLFTSDFAAANNSGGRGERWAIGLNLLRTSPIWGFGLGRFGGAIAMQNQTVENLEYFYMDNYYLKTLVEMGYVGFIGYLFLLISNVFATIRGLFRTRFDRISLLAVGMFCGMAGVLAHSFFENIFEVPYMNSYFWGMAAAIMYICFLRRKSAVKS